MIISYITYKDGRLGQMKGEMLDYFFYIYLLFH